jgi:hypothetical protein
MRALSVNPESLSRIGDLSAGARWYLFITPRKRIMARRRYKSECPQGHHDCLEKLPPQQVVDAIISMLGEGRSRLSLLFKILGLSAF